MFNREVIEINAAQKRLDDLFRRASAGSQIIIARDGKQVAELVPVGALTRTPFTPWVDRVSSEWRRIWKQSIHAGKLLAVGRKNGEDEFAELKRQYPNDGMVHYERGEALEYLARFEEAVQEYTAAQELFPVPKWKNVAAESLRRAAARGKNPHQGPQWRVFHMLHACPHLPDKVRYFGICAVSRIDAEPEMAAGAIRACRDLLLGERLALSGSKNAVREIHRIGSEALHQGTITDYGVKQLLQHFGVLITDAEAELRGR